MASPAATKKRKAKAPPPAGYVCKLCKEPGHWVYECAQCVKKPKTAKPPPKPNPCVSTEEARIKCHCGLRAMKRRSWKADAAAALLVSGAAAADAATTTTALPGRRRLGELGAARLDQARADPGDLLGAGLARGPRARRRRRFEARIASRIDVGRHDTFLFSFGLFFAF